MKRICLTLWSVVVLICSCERENEFSNKGKPIQFSATSSSVNTKTAYQGSTQNGKEAILWEEGDTFRVFSDEAVVSGSTQKWADYKVSVSDGVATAVNPLTAGKDLLWNQGTHHFYAVYPVGEIKGKVVEASIPGVQEPKKINSGEFVADLSKNGFMAAAADGNPDDAVVNLNFKPMFTTLEFIVSPGYDSDVHVGSFSLKVKDGSKVVLSGGFKATLSSQADPEIAVDYSGASGEIKVYFGEDGVIVRKGESLTFSVLALPIELTDLVAVFTMDGVVREYPLVDEDGKFIKIEAGQKARITALGLLNPDKYKVVFSVTIDGQDINDFNLSAPGADGTVGLLPGVFTIGDKKVRFSKGNLQAVLENGVITKWQFAENQWEVANRFEDISNGNGIVDQYLISTTAPLNNWGVFDGFWNHLNLYSEVDPQYLSDYYIGDVVPQWTNPDFVAGYGSGWTVLNDNEDNFFDYQRLLVTLISDEVGIHGSHTYTYKLNCTPAKIEGVIGLVVFPDGYVQPDDVPLELVESITTSSQMPINFPASNMNIYTSTQWAKMETAGAVFLPEGWYNGGRTRPFLPTSHFASGGQHQTVFWYEESVVVPTSWIYFTTGGHDETGPGMIRLVQVVE